jgi:acyl-CoA thioesterase
MTTDADEGRRGDQELLDLEVSADGLTSGVKLGDIHLSPLERLYGGAGASLASVAIEAAARRRLLWVTTQFVGACRAGDRLDLRADVVAAGRRTSQVQVRAYHDGRLVFQALGAAGDTRSEIPDGTLPAAPAVPEAADCPPLWEGAQSSLPGFFSMTEQWRVPDGNDQPNKWWMRLPGYRLTRPALLGLAGDCLPHLVMDGIGEAGAGTSLDNTIRAGAASDSEWVLIDAIPEQAAGGFGYGHVRLWAPGGTLVGVASQTAALWRSPG